MQCDNGHPADDLRPEGGILEDGAFIFQFTCQHAEGTVQGYDELVPVGVCDAGTTVRADVVEIKHEDTHEVVDINDQSIRGLFQQFEPVEVELDGHERPQVPASGVNIEFYDFDPYECVAEIAAEAPNGDRYIIRYEQ